MCTNDDIAHPQYDRDMNNVGLPSPSQYSPEALSQQFRYVVSIPVWILCGKVSDCTEIDIYCAVSLGELFLTFWRMMVPLSSRVSSLEDKGSLILQDFSNNSPSDTVRSQKIWILCYTTVRAPSLTTYVSFKHKIFHRFCFVGMWYTR